MKKIFSLLIVLTCILSVNAQDFKFGVSGGMNLNSITNNENKIGYNVGVKGEYFFKDDKGLYLDMGIMLTNKNWETPYYYNNGDKSATKWSANPHYLNIPIHIGYMMSVSKKFSVFVNAGPYLGLGLFGKYNMTSSNKNTTVADNIFEDYLKRFDYGIGGKIGVEYAKHIQLSAGYDWGLKNLKTKTYPMDYKNRSFDISCTYIF